jgi:hypothetical protein
LDSRYNNQAQQNQLQQNQALQNNLQQLLFQLNQILQVQLQQNQLQQNQLQQNQLGQISKKIQQSLSELHQSQQNQLKQLLQNQLQQVQLQQNQLEQNRAQLEQSLSSLIQIQENLQQQQILNEQQAQLQQNHQEQNKTQENNQKQTEQQQEQLIDLTQFGNKLNQLLLNQTEQNHEQLQKWELYESQLQQTQAQQEQIQQTQSLFRLPRGHNQQQELQISQDQIRQSCEQQSQNYENDFDSELAQLQQTQEQEQQGQPNQIHSLHKQFPQAQTQQNLRFENSQQLSELETNRVNEKKKKKKKKKKKVSKGLSVFSELHNQIVCEPDINSIIYTFDSIKRIYEVSCKLYADYLFKLISFPFLDELIEILGLQVAEGTFSIRINDFSRIYREYLNLLEIYGRNYGDIIFQIQNYKFDRNYRESWSEINSLYEKVILCRNYIEDQNKKLRLIMRKLNVFTKVSLEEKIKKWLENNPNGDANLNKYDKINEIKDELDKMQEPVEKLIEELTGRAEEPIIIEEESNNEENLQVLIGKCISILQENQKHMQESYRLYEYYLSSFNNCPYLYDLLRILEIEKSTDFFEFYFQDYRQQYQIGIFGKKSCNNILKELRGYAKAEDIHTIKPDLYEKLNSFAQNLDSCREKILYQKKQLIKFSKSLEKYDKTNFPKEEYLEKIKSWLVNNPKKNYEYKRLQDISSKIQASIKPPEEHKSKQSNINPDGLNKNTSSRPMKKQKLSDSQNQVNLILSDNQKLNDSKTNKLNFISKINQIPKLEFTGANEHERGLIDSHDALDKLLGPSKLRGGIAIMIIEYENSYIKRISVNDLNYFISKSDDSKEIKKFLDKYEYCFVTLSLGRADLAHTMLLKKERNRYKVFDPRRKSPSDINGKKLSDVLNGFFSVKKDEPVNCFSIMENLFKFQQEDEFVSGNTGAENACFFLCFMKLLDLECKLNLQNYSREKLISVVISLRKHYNEQVRLDKLITAENKKEADKLKEQDNQKEQDELKEQDNQKEQDELKEPKELKRYF